MNVLLTCAGRRNYLIRYFKEALHGAGLVFAADANPYAPSLQEADKAFVVPSVEERDYIDVLLDICRQNAVRLLVPLNDLELPLLSNSRETLLAHGVVPLVSTEEVIQTCFDKLRTGLFLTKIGLTSPRTYTSIDDALHDVDRGNLFFPVAIKPRWGSASLGIEYP